ncbi:hypothetical protein DdX_11450 [Ditylenchus destructor]|uniref:Uncharacterized protein n=1 Tax=Ditylenchus destructor TaxID=166010 RepID=A0AAD4R497_9BILA|nr:hypothetical protein DdX_11450 [Ditylenchus destructor]
MKRLPPARRKGDYISQIEAARKRRIEKDNFEDEVQEFNLDAEQRPQEPSISGSVIYDVPIVSGGLTLRRYRRIRKSDFRHHFSNSSRSNVAAANSGTKYSHLETSWPTQTMSVGDNTGEVISSQRYLRDMPLSQSITTESRHQHVELRPCTLSDPTPYELHSDSPTVYVESASTTSRRKNGSQQRVMWVSNRKDTLPYISNVDLEEDTANHNVRPRDFRVKQEVYSNTSELALGVPTHDVETDQVIAYECDIDTQNEAQDHVDVVDDSLAMEHHQELYFTAFPFASEPIDIHKLYELMARHKHSDSEHTLDNLLSDPTLSHPLNVSALVAAVRNANPEENAQAIASLAMQVNYLKRDMLKMKHELADLRSAFYLRENAAYSGRKFLPTAEITKDWKIAAMPPLREVDLVQVARELNINAAGKKPLKNRDAIARFVKALIPSEVVKNYTVRDRGQPKQNGAFDIGNHAKDQITGIVLDLMGLYNIDLLDNRGRSDRANYTQIVNHCMKSAM